MKRLVLVPFLWFAGGCAGQVTADANEKDVIPSPPIAEFDPANQIIPFPNNLLLNPATGRLNLPVQCGETPGGAAAVLRAELNELDGFGTSKPGISATFTAPVDPASLQARVFLVRLASRGMPLAAPEPVETGLTAGSTIRLGSDCVTPAMVSNISIVPTAPLVANSTYGVALVRGIRTTSGAAFQPSVTWSLVRQKVEPVQLDQSVSPPVVTYNATPFDPTISADLQSLIGLDLLWNAHNTLSPVLPAFDALLPILTAGAATSRDDVLLAFSFNTQTIRDAFDPAEDGTPASELTSATAPDAPAMPPPLAGTGGPLSVEGFYQMALPAAALPFVRNREAIGSIYIGADALGAPAPMFVSPTFQTGDDCDPATPTPPGRWSDPVTPIKSCDQSIPFLAVTPAAGTGPYKTVIFGHGLSRSKEDLLVIAGQLAAQGFASIAIDAVDHGARAVRVSSDPAIDCDGGVGPGRSCPTTFGPTCAPQCFAPVLSSDLAVTRDNLRQTVLDQMKLQRVLKYCATQSACRGLWVDPAHIGYLGQSLGSLIGGVTTAVSPDLMTAVFNVGGADWVQVFTDTLTVQIRCPVIDALLDGGILPGGAAAKWNLGANANALCLDPTASWKAQPGFLQFAQFARWILDPIDGVNYAAGYRAAASAKVLLQEVVGDQVVPNSATDEFGKLLGLTPGAASLPAAVPPAPTPAAAVMASSWIQYSNADPDAATMFPGVTYAHGSLLSPAAATAAGVTATLVMQVDVRAFLFINL